MAIPKEISVRRTIIIRIAENIAVPWVFGYQINV